jgi:hypothetical protein
METIDDIVREIAAEMLNTSMQDITAEVINRWALHLGDAATCKESRQVGNAAKMREALLEIVDCAKDVSERNLSYIEYQARQALSTPPRNCDLYETPKEAGDAFVNETCETPCEICSVSDRFRNPLIHECGINWLFAEAKGENK